MVEITLTSSINDDLYDGLILISDSVSSLKSDEKLKHLGEQIDQFAKVHTGIDSGKANVLFHSGVPSKRLIYSSTGPADDFDDVRIYLEAGKNAMKTALEAGVKSPLLAVVPSEKFQNSLLTATLGALHQLYVPLIVRQEDSTKASKIDRLGLLNNVASNSGRLLRFIDSLQSSFNVTRDIGDTDPQRMAPPKLADYVQQHFKNSSVKVLVDSDKEAIKKEYPLLAAVNRSANDVEEHQVFYNK